ncbi:MAG TPA: hypothetical protein V6C81_27000 [Planktothrix sp.]|jgi:hypothetical protein
MGVSIISAAGSFFFPDNRFRLIRTWHLAEKVVYGGALHLEVAVGDIRKRAVELCAPDY